MPRRATTPIERTIPMRKPPGFTPTVQRWSARFPARTRQLVVAYHGVQGDDDQAIARSPFMAWRAAALAEPAAPAAHDRARFVDAAGKVNHVLIGYWTDPERFTAFREASWNLSFWGSPRRLAEPTGYFREELRVAVDRQESIYFADFPAGMARCPEASLVPTFESGYWGAMRDRIPAAAADPLVSSFSGPLSPRDRPTEGARFRVLPPQNLAIIRSGQSWRRCGEQQLREYQTRMRPRLEKGLSYLAGSPEESGCCSLRYLHHGDAGEDQGETSVQGIFRSLADLERWAEGHRTHKAIHAEAFRQLRVYDERRELRTWHEVLVLAAREQRFEYLSCHPRTGLLPYFEAVRTDG